jgi:pimeloyl-ACP methyl ester carboxylesterase
MRTHDVPAGGGRTLRVHEAGDPAGKAVLAHHGTPMTGALFEPWALDASDRGIRLLGYDRPGYGGSTPDPGRTVASAAADAAAIADALGIDRFATWGSSGGGPHALACAALLPERVVGAASLGGLAPFDAEGLNLFRGMGGGNVVEFGAAMQGRAAIEPIAAAEMEAKLEVTGAELAAQLRSLVVPLDAAVLAGGFGAYWADSMREVFRQGTAGWVDDDLVFVMPFGFAVEDITVPVLVWHGRHDRFVPVAHGEWLAARIPGCEARISVDDGHLTLVAHCIPEVHAWLLRRF